MKTITLFFIVTIIFFNLGNAQVGVGTTSPNAQLDIRSSNQLTPSNIDGLLIPKIDEFPVTNPTINQDGMLVYVTGNGSVSIGFYYWDNAGASWINFSSIEKIDDLLDGKSDSDGTNDGSSIFLGDNSGVLDDQTDNGNVGIGYNALRFNIDGVFNTAIGYRSLLLNTSTANTAIGHNSLYQNTTGVGNTAIGRGSMQNSISGSNNVAIGRTAMAFNPSGSSNVAIGVSSGVNNIGNNNTFLGAFSGQHASQINTSGNVFLGVTAGQLETNSNRLYIDNSNTSSPLIYGEFDNNLMRINGTLDINNAYQFPLVDGIANQVLQTDGAGNVTWSNGSGGVEKIDDLLDGKSDSDGTNNGSSVFLGALSGANDNSTDNRNVGIGYNALLNNTIGNENVAIGHSALLNNFTAAGNIAIGSAALLSNFDGTGNVGLGFNALYFNTSGDDNTAVGNSALAHNTNGTLNVGLGRSAGANLNGDQNVYLGAFSGFSPISASRSGSVFLGYSSGLFETNNNRLYIENSNSTSPLVYGEFDNDLLRINGTLNINNAFSFPLFDGLANQVLQTNGAGQLVWTNISVGSPSLIIDADGDTKIDVEESNDEDIIRFDLNGSEKLVMQSNSNNILRFDLINNSNNILFGQNAGSVLNASAFNNIAIGFRALNSTINGAQNLAIGSSSLQNNIGTSNTAVGYEAMLGNINGENNVALGESAFRGNFNGSSNVVIGINSGGTINGNNNIFLGNEVGNGVSLRNLSGSVFIGHQSGFYETIDNRLYIENTNADAPLIGGSFTERTVGINREINLLSNALEVSGDASKSTSGAWLANSDKRLKKDILAISGLDALDKISRLSGVSYKWNDTRTGMNRPDHIQYGFIAQELMKVFPENVSQDKLGYYQTAYGNYDAFFVEAIKELKKQLDVKEDKIKSLEERLQILEAIIIKD